MAWWVFPAIATGLTAVGMYGSARNTSKASKAQIAADKQSLADILEGKRELDITASAKGEAAGVDYMKQLDITGLQSSTLRDRLFLTKDEAEAKSGLAYSGSVQEANARAIEQLNQDFNLKREGLIDTFEKTKAGIEEWRASEHARLTAEQRKIEARIGVARTTDTTLEALGWK